MRMPSLGVSGLKPPITTMSDSGTDRGGDIVAAAEAVAAAAVALCEEADAAALASDATLFAERMSSACWLGALRAESSSFCCSCNCSSNFLVTEAAAVQFAVVDYSKRTFKASMREPMDSSRRMDRCSCSSTRSSIFMNLPSLLFCQPRMNSSNSTLEGSLSADCSPSRGLVRRGVVGSLRRLRGLRFRGIVAHLDGVACCRCCCGCCGLAIHCTHMSVESLRRCGRAGFLKLARRPHLRWRQLAVLVEDCVEGAVTAVHEKPRPDPVAVVRLRALRVQAATATNIPAQTTRIYQ